MSQSFQKSTRELSKAVAATEQMQKAHREFLVAQTAWADAFQGWAAGETNEMIRDTYSESAPLWDIWASEQSEFIAQTRSFVYYEMGQLMGAAQDYMSATRETDKCRSALKKTQDGATKGGAKAGQFNAKLPAVKEALEKAKITEAQLRDKFTRLKHAVVKAGLHQMTSSYVKMCDVGSHLFGAMNDITAMMPDEVAEDDLTNADLASAKQIIADAVQNVPPARVQARYPGIFLHKKAEKFGKEKKRFFQLERNDGGTGSLFCYYQDVLRGLPYVRKGEVAINTDTEVDTNGKEILLRNPDRKWVLIAKTAEEARWWSGLLVQAKTGLPDHAVMVPCAVAESDIANITDARLRLDTAARKSQFGVSPTVSPSGAGGMEPVAESADTYTVNNEFKSEEGEGTLDLQPGDKVIVGEKGDDWWFAATLDGGADGWCPAVFLDPAGGGVSNASAAADPNAGWDDPAPADTEAPAAGGDEAAPLDGRYVRAAYDNEGAEDDELSFKEGDEIYQIQDADEYGWSRGILNEKEGIYPAAYVEEIAA